MEMETEELTRLMEDFYAVTGQRLGLFDADYRILMEMPEPHGPFCALIRSSTTGRERCRECDRTGLEQAQCTGRRCTYRCHAGLVEVCAPIRDEDGIVGYIMFGQLIYDQDVEEQWRTVARQCADLPINAAQLREMFASVRRLPPAYIRAASHIMEACVGYIRLGRLLRVQREGLWSAMQAYLREHAAGRFRLEAMARDLSVSRATLCKTAKAHTGRTVGQLVEERRMQLARRFLAETEDTVAEVAYRVGYEDDNYFIRVFHRAVGMTPGQYRRGLQDKTVVYAGDV